MKKGYNNKVVIHGGSGPNSAEIERDLVGRLSGLANNCLDFVPLESYEGHPPYAIVWYQEDKAGRDLFEPIRFTGFRRIVLHNPEEVDRPTEHAHVSVAYKEGHPSEEPIRMILRALKWNPDL